MSARTILLAVLVAVALTIPAVLAAVSGAGKSMPEMLNDAVTEAER